MEGSSCWKLIPSPSLYKKDSGCEYHRLMESHGMQSHDNEGGRGDMGEPGLQWARKSRCRLRSDAKPRLPRAGCPVLGSKPWPLIPSLSCWWLNHSTLILSSPSPFLGSFIHSFMHLFNKYLCKSCACNIPETCGSGATARSLISHTPAWERKS